MEALSMERDEIEDIKSREDQKIQVLLVRPHYWPLSSLGVFLTDSGESCCHLIAIAWLERTGKLFSFISLHLHKGIWGQKCGIPEPQSWKWF